MASCTSVEEIADRFHWRVIKSSSFPLRPGKKNRKSPVWTWRIIFKNHLPNHHFLDSMLIFQGFTVPQFNLLPFCFESPIRSTFSLKLHVSGRLGEGVLRNGSARLTVNPTSGLYPQLKKQNNWAFAKYLLIQCVMESIIDMNFFSFLAAMSRHIGAWF